MNFIFGVVLAALKNGSETSWKSGLLSGGGELNPGIFLRMVGPCAAEGSDNSRCGYMMEVRLFLSPEFILHAKASFKL